MQLKAILIGASLMALAACNTPIGAQVNEGGFGRPTANNVAAETGQLGYTIDLARRFAAEVPDTVNFAFDSDRLDGQAQAILMKQADWIRQFPEVRFRVFGYTDEVGGEPYNYGLGMRRARAVVNFLASQGISRARLQAVVSYGKTRPIIDVPTPERQNRRALTDVFGFVKNSPMVLDGKYADIVYRSYVASATPSNNANAGGYSADGGTTGSGSGSGGGSGSGPALK